MRMYVWRKYALLYYSTAVLRVRTRLHCSLSSINRKSIGGRPSSKSNILFQSLCSPPPYNERGASSTENINILWMMGGYSSFIVERQTRNTKPCLRTYTYFVSLVVWRGSREDVEWTRHVKPSPTLPASANRRCYGMRHTHVVNANQARQNVRCQGCTGRAECPTLKPTVVPWCPFFMSRQRSCLSRGETAIISPDTFICRQRARSRAGAHNKAPQKLAPATRHTSTCFSGAWSRFGCKDSRLITARRYIIPNQVLFCTFNNYVSYNDSDECVRVYSRRKDSSKVGREQTQKK